MGSFSPRSSVTASSVSTTRSSASLASGPLVSPLASGGGALGRELQVTVALPCARRDEVVAQVTPSGLLIEATVPPPAFAPGGEVVRLEIPYGRMRRRIELPAGNYTLLEFRLDEGFLFLRLTGTTL